MTEVPSGECFSYTEKELIYQFGASTSLPFAARGLEAEE